MTPIDWRDRTQTVMHGMIIDHPRDVHGIVRSIVEEHAVAMRRARAFIPRDKSTIFDEIRRKATLELRVDLAYFGAYVVREPDEPDAD